MSENTQKRKQLSIPVDDDLMARVESAAERDHRSVASFTRLVLARALDQGDAAMEA